MPHRLGQSHNTKRVLADERLQDLGFRREMVQMLWLRGNGRKAIADQLGIAEKTVERDVIFIRTQMVRDNAASLEGRIARTIGLRRRMQEELWRVFDKADNSAVNKVTSITEIRALENEINTLEGVAAPEKISTAALAEVQQTFLAFLMQRGGPTMVRDFLQELKSGQVSHMTNLLASTSDDGNAGNAGKMTVEADPVIEYAD